MENCDAHLCLCDKQTAKQRTELHSAKQAREKKRQVPVHKSLLSKSLADNQFACCQACKKPDSAGILADQRLSRKHHIT